MGFGSRSGWLEKLAARNPAVVAGAAVPKVGKGKATQANGKPVRLLLSEPPTRAKPRALESELQTRCVNWFRETYPELSTWKFFAIPNGGKRHAYTAKQLKKEGVVAGTPDLFLAVGRGGYLGFFLEAKVGGNDTSDLQDAAHLELASEGYQVAVFWTFEQFQELIRHYLAQEPTVTI